jgi:hypothetical protein
LLPISSACGFESSKGRVIGAGIVRAYLLQAHEMLFDILTEAFRVLGGVPQRGIRAGMIILPSVGRARSLQLLAWLASQAAPQIRTTAGG